MKTPLGTEVDLGAGRIVLDGFPAFRERGTALPSFRPMSIVATVAHSQLLLSSCFRNRMRGILIHITQWQFESKDKAQKRFALCYQTVVCPVCPVLSVTLVYCGQTVTWMNVKLGMGVGLGPGDIALDGNPAPLRKGAQHPRYSAHVYCYQTKMPLATEVGLVPDHIVLAAPPPILGPCLL